MLTGLKTLGRLLRKFRKSEDGGPTIEFVLVFFPFMLLTVSAYELGLLMTRHVMLERGVDMAVREVRLNTGVLINGEEFNEDHFKEMVCNAAGIIPNCDTQLRIEMIALDMRATNGVGTTSLPVEGECVSEADPFKTVDRFANGTADQMMVVRACARLVPMLPDSGLGWFLSRMEDGETGYYRLVSTSAFVMEPA